MNNNSDFNNTQFRARRSQGTAGDGQNTRSTSQPRQNPSSAQGERNTQSRPVARQPQNTQVRQNAQPVRRSPVSSEQRQAAPVRPANPANPRNDVSRQVNPQRPRRPLTDEERRRLEAARQAGTRTDLEGEARRRRQEQAQLSAAQSEIARQHRQELVSQQIPQPKRQQQKKRKNKVRINGGLVLFTLLLAGVIGVSLYQINQNGEDTTPDRPNYDVYDSIFDDGTADTSAETTDPAGTETSPDETTAETEEEVSANLNLYDVVAQPNTALDEGDLILVNAENGYADADTVTLKNIFNDRTVANQANTRKLLRVSRSDISMTAEAFAALEQLAVDLREETGDENLLINSGHRGTASQQSVWDNYMTQYGEDYTKSYVAVPGYSEHHTGLACDLGFYTDDGATISVGDYEYGWWLGANCMRRGFVLRYPEDKVSITGIAYEKWHFRYVGVPHAYAMVEKNYCLEEYIDFLKAYTFDTKMLHVRNDRTVEEFDTTAGELPKEDGWLIYYVPMTDGDSTDVKVPRDASYEISGNNRDGYIVTVTLDEE